MAYHINHDPLYSMLTIWEIMKKSKTNTTAISLEIKNKMIRLATLLDRFSK